DENTIALHSHPILIKDPKIGLRNLLSLDGENRRFDLDSLARRACRNSLMTGYLMSAEQAEYLSKELIKCRDPFTCPHGRPTLIQITDSFLEKQFLRR
ncbi:MAG: hypothetical protein PHV17_05195, partial [Candidatus Omnitrophica bacterium]|nr:hypothetical protein [Candidatus Omnitrophota bacterium]